MEAYQTSTPPHSFSEVSQYQLGLLQPDKHLTNALIGWSVPLHISTVKASFFCVSK